MSAVNSIKIIRNKKNITLKTMPELICIQISEISEIESNKQEVRLFL